LDAKGEDPERSIDGRVDSDTEGGKSEGVIVIPDVVSKRLPC
jgi:hypothetical protein